MGGSGCLMDTRTRFSSVPSLATTSLLLADALIAVGCPQHWHVHIVPRLTVSFILAAMGPVQKVWIWTCIVCWRTWDFAIGYEGQNMKALLGTSQHLVYSSFILMIPLSSFLDHDLTLVFPTLQVQVPPKDFMLYRGTSSPTSTRSGLPISTTTPKR